MLAAVLAWTPRSAWALPHSRAPGASLGDREALAADLEAVDGCEDPVCVFAGHADEALAVEDGDAADLVAVDAGLALWPARASPAAA